MKLDFCADDIKFSEFDPHTMVIEVESRDHLRELVKAIKLAFPRMIKYQVSEYVSAYNAVTKYYCMDDRYHDTLVHGSRTFVESFGYSIVKVEELVYIPLFSPSEMDIKYLFEK